MRKISYSKIPAQVRGFSSRFLDNQLEIDCNNSQIFCHPSGLLFVHFQSLVLLIHLVNIFQIVACF